MTTMSTTPKTTAGAAQEATNRFLVSYGFSTSDVFHGYLLVRANSKAAAEEAAKEEWINDWNLSFPDLPDGKREVRSRRFVAAIV